MGKRSIVSSILVLVLALSLSAFSYGQESSLPKLDGVDWLKDPGQTSQGWYLLGFISGVIEGVAVVLAETASRIDRTIQLYEKKNIDLGTLIIAKEHISNLNLTGITTSQINDGMNAFYSDFANKRIKIIDAIFIVKMQIDGRDPDLIQAQTRYLRMQKIDPEEVHRIIAKISTTEAITDEEWLKYGLFRVKSGALKALFCYGDY
jgi:hypothetical protein